MCRQLYNTFTRLNAMLKDYYKILEVSPGAGADELKKSFRRLAQRYHPDKLGEAAAAGAQFRLVQEAYEVLTDPVKKELYLQQRWLEQAQGRKFATATPLSTDQILLEAIALEQFISTLDPFRTDHYSLFHTYETLLSEEAVILLRQASAAPLRRKVIFFLLKSGQGFDLAMANKLTGLLQKIIPEEDHPDRQMLEEYLREKRKQHRIEKWKPVLVILATLLCCSLIYLFSR